jgi:hypothetical protein
LLSIGAVLILETPKTLGVKFIHHPKYGCHNH